MHQDRPLMLGHGKFAEAMTRRLIRDMQYSSLLPVDQQWLQNAHHATADDVKVEEKVYHHECRKTRAVNDACIKALTTIMLNRFPPDQGEQQRVMNNMNDLIWVGACYVWQMVDNIENWLELGPGAQVGLVYDGVEGDPTQ